MTINTQRNPVCKSGGWKTLRNAVDADLPELMRLVCSEQADAGSLADISFAKTNAALKTGIARDGSMLLVEPGTGGRLNGFLLFGFVERWLSTTPRFAEICFCADRGHLRSKSVRELRQFSAWARKSESERNAGDAVAKSILGAQEQNCVAEAPRAGASGGPDKAASDAKPVTPQIWHRL